MRYPGKPFFSAQLPAGARITPTVDDAMADIATVFHWPLASLVPLPLGELLAWREHAYRRSSGD